MRSFVPAPSGARPFRTVAAAVLAIGALAAAACGGSAVADDAEAPARAGDAAADGPSAEERRAAIIESIRTKLLTLPPETVVHTGHGDDTTVGAEAPGIEAAAG